MLTALAVLLLSTIALLAIPVTVTFQIARGEVSKNDVRLCWAFGLVRVQIAPTQSGEHPQGSKVKKPKNRRSESSRQGARDAFAVIRQTPFRQRIYRFIGDVWRAVRKHDLRLHVRMGLGDPADTGQLWAFMGPVAGVLANAQSASISIEPDFLDATFELDSSGTVRVVPLQLLYLAVALLFSPTLWRAFVQMRRGGR